MSPDDPIPPIDEPTDEADALTEETVVAAPLTGEDAADEGSERDAEESEAHDEPAEDEAIPEGLDTDLPEWPEDESGGSTGCLKALAACGCFFLLVLCAITGVAIWIGFDAVGGAKQAFLLNEMTIEDSGLESPPEVDDANEDPAVEGVEGTGDETTHPYATDPRWRQTAPRRDWDVRNPCSGTLRQRSAALEMREDGAPAVESKEAEGEGLPLQGEADDVLPDERD